MSAIKRTIRKNTRTIHKKSPDWLFNGEIFNISKYTGYYGFTYLITNNIDKRKYIGKKAFYIKRNGKYVESNWRNYFSSSKELKSDVLYYGKDKFTREILSLHKNKSDLTYAEIKIQFLYSVIESGDWYNANIARKIFSKSI